MASYTTGEVQRSDMSSSVQGEAGSGVPTGGDPEHQVVLTSGGPTTAHCQ